jgi:hypothetical protein
MNVFLAALDEHYVELRKTQPVGVAMRKSRKVGKEVSPRLRGLRKMMLLGGGIIGGLEAVPALRPAAAVVGAVVSVSPALWTGRLLRGAARIKWLRWALEWDL